jgi:hypothetical protein
MWKVGDVEPMKVMGAEGYPYGFNVTTEDGKPVVSFALRITSPRRGSGNTKIPLPPVRIGHRFIGCATLRGTWRGV